MKTLQIYLIDFYIFVGHNFGYRPQIPLIPQRVIRGHWLSCVGSYTSLKGHLYPWSLGDPAVQLICMLAIWRVTLTWSFPFLGQLITLFFVHGLTLVNSCTVKLTPTIGLIVPILPLQGYFLPFINNNKHSLSTFYVAEFAKCLSFCISCFHGS